MNIPFTELSDPPPQPALARRFIWRATLPALVCGLPALLSIPSLTLPWTDASPHQTAFSGAAVLLMLTLAAVARARHQLTELRESGGVLSEAMVSFTPERKLVSRA